MQKENAFFFSFLNESSFDAKHQRYKNFVFFVAAANFLLFTFHFYLFFVLLQAL